MPEQYFQIFSRIINGNLRPHIFISDGKRIESIFRELQVKDKAFNSYLKYLDKIGRNYQFKIKNEKKQLVRLIININENFNELNDLDIPLIPDHKGEVYLNMIEFEYVINIERCKNFIEEHSKIEIEEYALKNFQKLQLLWEDLNLYKKLIIKDSKKGLDFNNSDEFVVWTLQEYLERTIEEYFKLLNPFMSTDKLRLKLQDIFAERDQKSKEINEKFRQLNLEKTLHIDKRYSKDFKRKN